MESEPASVITMAKNYNMKKIIFTLLALVGTMSMNAQVMKVMKNGEVVAVFTADQANNVVFEEILFGQGYAAATGIGYVKWVQLWENGPKFAEYNVGATSATEYGGYYTWGGTFKNEQDSWQDDHNTGTSDLYGDTDTATKLWGDNWRMPTNDEFSDLLSNCDVQWTTFGGLNGCKFTGKGNYSSNSVFLPAADYCDDGDVYGQGYSGYYWSSTPNGSDNAYLLNFGSGGQYVGDDNRSHGYSVRAVLKETPATTGTAKAKINGVDVEVNWVQLWKDGPKFAEKNVGATSATDQGTTMKFTEATKAGAEYVWGANWCTPSKDDMEHLMTAAKGGTDDKVKCEYTQEGSQYGFKFTGLTDGYTDNSVFFPAQDGGSNGGYAGYWSATADGSEAWDMDLLCADGVWRSSWYSDGQGSNYFVRPVLKK